MKVLLALLVPLLVSGCVCSSELDNRLNQDFLNDLASENNRIAGDLYLDFFNEDLSNLSYDYYLTFITVNEAPSAKGFSSLVKDADYHYFKTKKESFIIALFYKKEKTVVCDNSSTAFLDSVKTFGTNDTIPELSQFASKLFNK